MTPGIDARRRRTTARRIALRIGAVVARDTPPGLASWPALPSVVGDAVDGFLDALAAFEAADTPGTRGAVNVAADRLVAAWRGARDEWEARGQPGPPAPAGRIRREGIR